MRIRHLPLKCNQGHAYEQFRLIAFRAVSRHVALDSDRQRATTAAGGPTGLQILTTRAPPFRTG